MRRQFEISLEQECNRTKRHPSDFSLAILDIDFFKKVNDTYGHQYGDYVLKTVADLMKQSFRKTDLLYRYGGEELVMIMPETNIEEIIQVIVDNGRIEDMHELSDILEDTIEILEQ